MRFGVGIFMTKILYCNWCLATRSGTEIVSIETVLGLRRLGHQVAVLLSYDGQPSEPLKRAEIPVLTSLDSIPWCPDIVHSNHLPQSLLAAMTFPNVPQIFVCHDPGAAHSEPPRLPIVREYFAVDELCAQRIRPIANEVSLLPNAFDESRYSLRTELPQRPRRALLLAKGKDHMMAVLQACQQCDIKVEWLGAAWRQEVEDLAVRLHDFDLVFAAARNALESMASGCAVIVIDHRGLAGMVRSSHVDAWRTHNFGNRLLTRLPTVDSIVSEIRSYDPIDARRVSHRIREVANLESYLDALVAIYERVILRHRRFPIACPATSPAFERGLHSALPYLLQTQPATEIASMAFRTG